MHVKFEFDIVTLNLALILIVKVFKINIEKQKGLVPSLQQEK